MIVHSYSAYSQQRQYQMATIRSYIRHNQEFIQERDRYTARPNYNQTINRKTNLTALSQSHHSNLIPISLIKKRSLPPIQECSPKNQLFSLELKRSQQLSRYFQSKNQALVSNRNMRSKTEPNENKQSSSRTHFALNLSEVRMRPLDKYFYRMENIRLAERLLVVKPSPDIRRPILKQFFKKQKHYSNQISHNTRPKKKSEKIMKSKLSELQKHWIN